MLGFDKCGNEPIHGTDRQFGWCLYLTRVVISAVELSNDIWPGSELFESVRDHVVETPVPEHG